MPPSWLHHLADLYVGAEGVEGQRYAVEVVCQLASCGEQGVWQGWVRAVGVRQGTRQGSKQGIEQWTWPPTDCRSYNNTLLGGSSAPSPHPARVISPARVTIVAGKSTIVACVWRTNFQCRAILECRQSS